MELRPSRAHQGTGSETTNDNHIGTAPDVSVQYGTPGRLLQTETKWRGSCSRADGGRNSRCRVDVECYFVGEISKKECHSRSSRQSGLRRFWNRRGIEFLLRFSRGQRHEGLRDFLPDSGKRRAVELSLPFARPHEPIVIFGRQQISPVPHTFETYRRLLPLVKRRLAK
jgi:hypothetical protein